MPLLTLVVVLSPILGGAQDAAVMELTLHQEFGRAGFKECRLRVGSNGIAALASLRCTVNSMEHREVLNQRYLDAAELIEVGRLVENGELWSGGHVGADGTPSDRVFETLKLTQTAPGSRAMRTVVLVTSGNPAFAGGPRHALWLWLDSLRTELRRGLKRAP